MPAAEVSLLVKAIGMSRERLVYGLEKVPEDRLAWSPGADAKSPLALAGGAVGFLAFLTYLMAHRVFPERPAEMPPPPATREAAIAAVDAGFLQLESAITALNDEDLLQLVPSVWGEEVPLAEMLWWLMYVLGYLQGQINYAQTAYGDQDPNMPPSWYARATKAE